MKKLMCFGFAAVCLLASLTGCGDKDKSAGSAVGSAVSGAASNMGEAAEDIGEGVTAAVSAVVSEADRMYENGKIGDDETEPGTVAYETEPTEDTLAEITVPGEE